MQSKSLIWLGLFIGPTIGSFIPMLWGGDMFSFSSIILSGLGGIAGIYIFLKLAKIKIYKYYYLTKNQNYD